MESQSDKPKVNYIPIKLGCEVYRNCISRTVKNGISRPVIDAFTTNLQSISGHEDSQFRIKESYYLPSCDISQISLFWTLFESLELLMPLNIDEIIQILPLGGVGDKFVLRIQEERPRFPISCSL